MTIEIGFLIFAAILLVAGIICEFIKTKRKYSSLLLLSGDVILLATLISTDNVYVSTACICIMAIIIIVLSSHKTN